MTIFVKAYKIKTIISEQFLPALLKRKIYIKFLFASLKTLKALFGRFSPEYNKAGFGIFRITDGFWNSS
jgi:hypothetical protein